MATPGGVTGSFVEGQALGAAALNELASLARSGFDGLRGGDAMAPAAAQIPVEWLDKAVIVRREPEVWPAGLPPFPAQVYYWWQLWGSPEAVGVRVQPVYGRPAFGLDCRIIPAAVGDVCGVIRQPDAEGQWRSHMVVFTETIARKVCGNGEAGAGGGGAAGKNVFAPRPSPSARSVLRIRL